MNPLFIELLSHYQSWMKIPKDRKVKKIVGEIYKQERQQLKQLFEQECQSISISVDLWTSTNFISILAINGHWITSTEFKYREELLEFVEIEGHHTGENIAKYIIDCLRSYSLESKLFYLVGDNAGNNHTLA
jgi:3-dehydroquinate synthase class II